MQAFYPMPRWVYLKRVAQVHPIVIGIRLLGDVSLPLGVYSKLSLISARNAQSFYTQYRGGLLCPDVLRS
jgi:hypothetical protein